MVTVGGSAGQIGAQKWFHPGSNRGPSLRKSDVITNYTMKPLNIKERKRSHKKRKREVRERKGEEEIRGRSKGEEEHKVREQRG